MQSDEDHSLTAPSDPSPPAEQHGSVDRIQREAYWPLPLGRAVPAALVALIVTFSADHSARFGLLSFGALALASGLVIALVAGRRLRMTAARPYLLAQGIVSMLLGVVGLTTSGFGIGALFLIVTVWGVTTGGLELYAGVRTRGGFVGSGDFLAVGAATVLVALVTVLLPVDFAQDFTGPDGIARVLDASVITVGVLGAYSAIIAVYLVIGGLSAKWGTRPVPPATDVALKG